MKINKMKDYIIKNYSVVSDSDIGIMFAVSPQAVAVCRKRLGLTKGVEMVKQLQERRRELDRLNGKRGLGDD